MLLWEQLPPAFVRDVIALIAGYAAPLPTHNSVAIGIDLGVCKSCVAFYKPEPPRSRARLWPGEEIRLQWNDLHGSHVWTDCQTLPDTLTADRAEPTMDSGVAFFAPPLPSRTLTTPSATTTTTTAPSAGSGGNVAMSSLSAAPPSAAATEVRLLGAAARRAAVAAPQSTVTHLKQLLGRKWSDSSTQQLVASLPFRVVEGPGDTLLVELHAEGQVYRYTPAEIATPLLSAMRANAQAAIGAPPPTNDHPWSSTNVAWPSAFVSDCVLTVPHTYTAEQRRALTQAAVYAGFNVLACVDDAVAAAMAYALHNTDNTHSALSAVTAGAGQRRIVVVDWSSTRLIVSVLQTTGQPLERAFTCVGRAELAIGGSHFDARIADHCAAQFVAQHKARDPPAPLITAASRPRAYARLRDECERLKRTLTSQTLRSDTMPRRALTDPPTVASIALDSLVSGIDLTYKTTRARIEAECDRATPSSATTTTTAAAATSDAKADGGGGGSAFGRALQCVADALSAAKVAPEDVTDLVLSGGVTRMLRVQALLREWFLAARPAAPAASASSAPPASVAAAAPTPAVAVWSLPPPPPPQPEPFREWCTIPGDEVGARGAAILATHLHEHRKVTDCGDTLPYGLGVEVLGLGVHQPILSAGTAFPVEGVMQFSTLSRGQPRATVRVWMGPRTRLLPNAAAAAAAAVTATGTAAADDTKGVVPIALQNVCLAELRLTELDYGALVYWHPQIKV